MKMQSYLIILECVPDLTCCDGYLSVCDTDFECEPSEDWDADDWPSEFFASVIDRMNNNNSCCFVLKSSQNDGTTSEIILIKPETDEEYYEFENGYSVVNVQPCVCNKCHSFM